MSWNANHVATRLKSRMLVPALHIDERDNANWLCNSRPIILPKAICMAASKTIELIIRPPLQQLVSTRTSRKMREATLTLPMPSGRQNSSFIFMAKSYASASLFSSKGSSRNSMALHLQQKFHVSIKGPYHKPRGNGQVKFVWVWTYCFCFSCCCCYFCFFC